MYLKISEGDCSSRWESGNREGDVEGQLYLQNYTEICKRNWDHVKEVISLDAKDKKAKTINTKWINSLNDIRNKAFHPEKGHLKTEEVKFVKEHFNKVKEFFSRIKYIQSNWLIAFQE